MVWAMRLYSISDPRERIFKGYVQELSEAKNRQRDMGLYSMIEEVAPELIGEKRKIFKGVSPNVDFYSGFVYEMLGIPVDTVHPHLCHCPYCGLECPQDRGAGGNGQDYPPGLHQCDGEERAGEYSGTEIRSRIS